MEQLQDSLQEGRARPCKHENKQEHRAYFKKMYLGKKALEIFLGIKMVSGH